MNKQILIVLWVDSFSCATEWGELANVPKKIEPLFVTSVGFELRRDKNTLTLAMTLTADDHPEVSEQFNGTLNIPIGCIRDEWVVEH